MPRASLATATWSELRRDWPFLLFLCLVAVRPIVDTQWQVKYITPFYSPLYITGQLTLLVVTIGLILPRKRLPAFTVADVPFVVFTLMLLLNVAVMLGMEGSRIALKIGMKALLVVVVYWFARRRITAAGGLESLAGVVMRGSLVAYVMVAADMMFGPFGIRERSGFVRYIGLYSHVASYSIFLLTGVTSTVYLWLRRRSRSLATLAALQLTVLALALPLLIHMTTTALAAVLAGLMVLFVFFAVHSWRMRLASLLLVVVLAMSVVVRSSHQWSVAFKPEVAVLEGTGDGNRFMNGRGAIWNHYARIFDTVPLAGKVLGPPLTGVNTEGALGATSHSDMLRLLFTVGYAGVAVYVLFLLTLIPALRRLSLPERFLSLAALIILFGYSVSMTPTFYTNTVTFLVPILAMTASAARPIRWVGRTSSGDAK
jgi:O-antigen ligase